MQTAEGGPAVPLEFCGNASGDFKVRILFEILGCDDFCPVLAHAVMRIERLPTVT